MRKIMLMAVASCALAAPAISPALADEVGVRVTPPAADVTVGESPRVSEERKTVIKKDEPGGQTTVIKKEHDDGSSSKTVIHRDNN